MAKHISFSLISIIIAIIICTPRIVITLMHSDQWYSIIDAIVAIFWFIGFYFIEHRKPKTGLAIQCSSIAILWILLILHLSSYRVVTSILTLGTLRDVFLMIKRKNTSNTKEYR